jgi:hypothetical protein
MKLLAHKINELIVVLLVINKNIEKLFITDLSKQGRKQKNQTLFKIGLHPPPLPPLIISTTVAYASMFVFIECYRSLSLSLSLSHPLILSLLFFTLLLSIYYHECVCLCRSLSLSLSFSLSPIL